LDFGHFGIREGEIINRNQEGFININDPGGGTKVPYFLVHHKECTIPQSFIGLRYFDYLPWKLTLPDICLLQFKAKECSVNAV
jgi:hypothetical protein